MDTRGKILTPGNAAAAAAELHRQGVRLRVVTGHFDVLLAEHVRELIRVRDAGESGKLRVVLTTPANPVLSARARSELVAALAMVDYVVAAEPECREPLLRVLNAEDVVAFEPSDERRAQELIEHVHRRQAG